MPLSPSRDNIQAAGITEWAFKAAGDTGYAVLPYLRNANVEIEELYEADTQGRQELVAYQLTALAEFLPTMYLLKHPQLLVYLGTMVVEHRIQLQGGGYISSAPLNSAPSPTGFGVKWRFCSDREMEDACYLEITASRRLSISEYAQITTSANVDATVAISSDTFYAFTNLSRSDVIVSGIKLLELGTDAGFGDVVDSMRHTKFEAELQVTDDGRGGYIGHSVRVDFECQPLETSEAEIQKWPGIATRGNYSRLTFNSGLVANISAGMGFIWDYKSDTDLQDPAHGKIVASGVLQFKDFINMTKVADVAALLCFGGVSIANGVTRYIEFDYPVATTGNNDFKLFLPAGVLNNLRVAGGGGNATTFSCTVMQNGNATALLVSGVTTPGAGGWGSAVADTTDQLTIAAGDYVCLKIVNSGSNQLANVSVYCEFVPS